MNNKRQNKQPFFAEVNLTGDEFEICLLHADLHYFPVHGASGHAETVLWTSRNHQ